MKETFVKHLGGQIAPGCGIRLVDCRSSTEGHPIARSLSGRLQSAMERRFHLFTSSITICIGELVVLIAVLGAGRDGVLNNLAAWPWTKFLLTAKTSVWKDDVEA